MFPLEEVKQEAQSLKSELFEIYKDLHQHPESSWEEFRTSKIVEDYLRTLGLEVKTNIGYTGVVGGLDTGKPGKTLLLRADMDALLMDDLCGLPYQSENPGVCHSCGHDSHVAMLLGAAKILCTHKDAFSGRIKFAFQACEENTFNKDIRKKVADAGYVGRPEAGLGGARAMVQDGILEDVDACMAIHVAAEIPIGTIKIRKDRACASTDFFEITLIGKGGHGSAPHLVIDPVPAMAELVQAIHMLPTREINALETTVFHIGEIHTPGSTASSVADRVVIKGGFRAFHDKTRAILSRRIKELTYRTAEAWRCSVEYEFHTGYSPTINDAELSAKVANSCTKILGMKNVFYTEAPSLTAEDFSEFSRLRPSVYMNLGVAVGEDYPILHNPRFHVSAEALPIGVEVHVQNALDYLNS